MGMLQKQVRVQVGEREGLVEASCALPAESLALHTAQAG